ARIASGPKDTSAAPARNLEPGTASSDAKRRGRFSRRITTEVFRDFAFPLAAPHTRAGADPALSVQHHLNPRARGAERAPFSPLLSSIETVGAQNARPFSLPRHGLTPPASYANKRSLLR